MRTALILLFLLAIGAIPGSVLPQRGVSVDQVTNYFLDHPDIAPWLDRFYLFDVYTSPWYAAIYLLLFVSLTGCVLPRAMAHYRTMRGRPPKTPRNLNRMPYCARFTTDKAPDAVLEHARSVLKGYRMETDAPADAATCTSSIAAEKGYLRETGNVVFHLALLAILLAVAAGSFYGYRGNMLVVEGTGFANGVPSYDAYYPGTAVNAGDLQPFSFNVDDFKATFIEGGKLSGQADSYAADLSYKEAPDAPEKHHKLEVNEPLSVDGAQVYLLGHGYAPEFEVTNADGDVVFDQAVPFLYRDTFSFTSDGVIKVPDTGDDDQLGFSAVFYPSAAKTPQGELTSDFPDTRDPVVTLQAYQGDLGMRSPQSVYQLYTEKMDELGESPEMRPGDTWKLPDGAGSVTFKGYRDYLSMQVNSNPARIPALLAASVAVVGLLAALFVRPRRAWVRAKRGDDGRTVVEVAGLSKTDAAWATAEFHRIARTLRDRLRDAPANDAGMKE
ncbi:cytochrome c biogenesis protein ResB [Nocardiopsis gilva YIM 90087]|uniref:Cytochrome c biogenesis protein ResB n=2 Tax=Nocardiopsis gilva TaxID=280236 RepID=A0A223SEB8_9ACTN|nr:cytochrome c biogenesis protein ResB [Nocardiopsis gilva]ASU86433.1 cytochrome c biogenesis protein ResB [Nocardiopsis gilva YIM 90087]